MSLASKGARRTAALNFVENDLLLGEVLEDLEGAMADFSNEAVNLSQAQSNYDTAKSDFEECKTRLTLEVIEDQVTQNSKVTQAAIDRATLVQLEADTEFGKLRENLGVRKAELDDAKADYDTARLQHRTLTSKVAAFTATLNYLAASKNAAAVAAGQLASL